MRSGIYATVGRPSVSPSVRLVIRPSHVAAAGLLLSARHAGDIDRLQHGAQQHGTQQRL